MNSVMPEVKVGTLIEWLGEANAFSIVVKYEKCRAEEYHKFFPDTNDTISFENFGPNNNKRTMKVVRYWALKEFFECDVIKIHNVK